MNAHKKNPTGMCTGTKSPSTYTFVFLEVERVLLVGDDLFQVDDVLVIQLPQNLDLAHRRDGKALLLVLQANLLQRYHLTYSEETPGMR